MRCCNPAALAARLGRGERLIGLDVGEKTVGVALSDTSLAIATPAHTLKRDRFGPVAEALADLARRERAGGFVIGYPVNMDGSHGPACQRIEQFAANLEERLALPWLLWDERWSTAAVERQMIAADMTRKKRQKAVDNAAAAYILQGALDSLARARGAGKDSDGTA